MKIISVYCAIWIIGWLRTDKYLLNSKYTDIQLYINGCFPPNLYIQMYYKYTINHNK